MYDRLQYVLNVQSGFRRDQRRFLRVQPDHIFNLFFDTFRIGARKIHFVNHRHHVQIMI